MKGLSRRDLEGRIMPFRSEGGVLSNGLKFSGFLGGGGICRVHVGLLVFHMTYTLSCFFQGASKMDLGHQCFSMCVLVADHFKPPTSDVHPTL